MEHLKTLIREVPDFPKPGILFYDITTLLKDPNGLKQLSDAFAERYADNPPDVVAGIEARGFIFGPMLAARLDRGFVPIRKPGKLPSATSRISYDLEYGQDTLEIHTDAVGHGQSVLVVDDLLATGGTARATCDLVEQLGGKIHGLAFVVELTFLPGRSKLGDYDVYSLLSYDS
ncbi:MAG: adenine phosphoribosyltransferase [Bryobacterales bacterium]